MKRTLLITLLAACGDDGADCPIDLSTGRDCHGVRPDGRWLNERCEPAITNTLTRCPIYLRGAALTKIDAVELCGVWHNEVDRCGVLIDAAIACWNVQPPICDCDDELASATSCWMGP